MSALSLEVRELLELIRDALDLPYGATADDNRARRELRNDNASRVIGHLDVILGDTPVPISTSVQVMRKHLADNPVNYAVRDEDAGTTDGEGCIR